MYTPLARRASSSASSTSVAIVEHDGELGGQLAEQPGGVQTQRVGDDLDDAPVADLEAVTERAVDDVAAPVLGEPVDVGELVDQAGGGEHPTGDDGVTADELDAEVVVVGAGHVDSPGRRGPHRRSCGPPRDRWRSSSDGRSPFVTEVAVHVCGGGVARLAGVDDDHRAALAPELQGGGEPGGRSADDGDVAVPLDGADGVVTHGVDDTVSAERSTWSPTFSIFGRLRPIRRSRHRARACCGHGCLP